jgi:hypothetical protein
LKLTFSNITFVSSISQVYSTKEKVKFIYFLSFHLYVIITHKSISLNFIMKKYLFPTFIIAKFHKFCIQLKINPMESTMVSKWNLNRIWIYFFVFLSKNYFIFYSILDQGHLIVYFSRLSPYTRRNLVICNHFFCNYMKLYVGCDYIWFSLQLIINVHTSYGEIWLCCNYHATIDTFIFSFGWLLGLFSSKNKLICSIGCIWDHN